MRITLLAIGSRGDVQPLAALAARLQTRGHAVHLVAGDEFGGLVESAGIAFTPLGVTIQAEMEAHTDLFRLMAALKDRILAACEGAPDAIVATFMGVAACPLARARGTPFFYAAPMPSLETRAHPHPLFPPLPLGQGYNVMTYRLADGRATRACEDARCLFVEPRPTTLLCYSSQIAPRPTDWGDYAHVTGYWFLDRPAHWQPPADLEAFLQADAPPVCVGFGSMVGADPSRMTALVTEALARAGQRGVLVSRWGGLEPGAISPTLYAARSLPYDWLCSRVSAAVHHGGAGTTAAALRAGIPSVIIPFGMDQPFWARQIASLGAGVGPIWPRRLTAECLAGAIRRAVEDEPMRARAAEIGARIRAEDGVGVAATIIERVAA